MIGGGLDDPSGLRDGLRLGAGTFTAIRVSPPVRVDPKAWRVAMSTAPLWGALIGMLATATGVACWWLAGVFGSQTLATATLAGVISVATYALLTRGLHYDGLADTCDGFGSARVGAGALDVMKDPALGALGGLSMMLTVLLQTAAWGQFVTGDTPAAAVAIGASAMMLARAPLMWIARIGTPAPDRGLGREVVGSFPAARALAFGGGWTIIATGLIVTSGVSMIMAVVTAAGVWALAAGVRRSAIRRFGAVNGDVLGAIIEGGGTVGLVLLALVGS